MLTTLRKYYNSHGLVAVFVLLSLVYIGLTLRVSPNQAALKKYHLSVTQFIVLSLTIVIPYIIIWSIAVFGYLRLKLYALPIQKSQDGAAFWQISKGVLGLALWLPASGVMGGIVNQIVKSHPSLTADAVRIQNYIVIIILFVSYYLLNQGALKLRRLVQTKPNPLTERRFQVLALAAGVAYIALVLHDPYRQYPPASLPTSSNFLSIWPLLTTVIIPRLILWYLGVQAVWNMYLYSRHVPGTLYRRVLRRATIGLGLVISMTIAVRFLNTVYSLGKASLGAILIIVYILLIIMGAGYLLLAKGASDLKDIEQV